MPLVLKTVVSGAQTGVDQAALRAARAVGLKTDGWMTHGARTLDGPRPDLLVLYQLREHASPDYKHRTFANVQLGEATLRIAQDFNSSGECCTLRAIEAYGRPKLDVCPEGLTDDRLTAIAVREVVEWISDWSVRTLNVAGNSEQTSPGIGAWAEVFLKRVFKASMPPRRSEAAWGVGGMELRREIP